MKEIFTLILGLSLGVSISHLEITHTQNIQDKGEFVGWIPDARTASAVGKAIIAGRYGDRYVELFKRFIAVKKKGYWYVRPEGLIDDGYFSQEYEVVLNPISGQVVEMHSYIPSL